MKRNEKHINNLRQYVIKTKAEMDEVLWLIKEGDYKSVADYIEDMTLLINGKQKDIYGKFIKVSN